MDNLDKILVLKDECRSILDVAKTEQRSLKEDEQALFDQKQQEIKTLETEERSVDTPETNQKNNNTMPKYNEHVAEIIKDFAEKRSAINSFDLSERAINTFEGTGSIQETTVHEIYTPLQKNLLIDQLGCRMVVDASEDLYPVASQIEASFEGENTSVADTTVPFTSKKATRRRVAVSIPMSNRSLSASEKVFPFIHAETMKAQARSLDKVLFGAAAVQGCSGVFVGKTPVFSKTAAQEVTLKEVIAIESAVKSAKANTGDGTAAYIVSPKMEGYLKGTPVAAGSDKMILVDGKMNGYPVLVSHDIAEDVIGYGVFSNVVIKNFDNTEIIIDQASRSKENVTSFNSNGDFDIVILAPEAFAVGKKLWA